MNLHAEFLAIVSGRRRDWAAQVLRSLLAALEVPYTAAMRLRNRRYDRGPGVWYVEVPVISVGNLTLGGTGKTPLVAWIARHLGARGARVALVSRGYKAAAAGINDEALELAERLPGVPHLQCRDRLLAAQRAVGELNCDVIVLDDGFQHRRLGRDLNIVLLDASEPFGFEHVFPRGLLREPAEGLDRADVVILSRADMIGPDQRAAIRERVRLLAPVADWAEVRHAPQQWLATDGSSQPLAALAGRPVAAFCGLGSPDGFRHTLEACGVRLVDFRTFDDHHRYDQADADALARWGDSLDVAALVTTHKDLVKLRATNLGSRPLWALAVEIEFLKGRDVLEAQLDRVMAEAS